MITSLFQPIIKKMIVSITATFRGASRRHHINCRASIFDLPSTHHQSSSSQNDIYFDFFFFPFSSIFLNDFLHIYNNLLSLYSLKCVWQKIHYLSFSLPGTILIPGCMCQIRRANKSHVHETEGTPHSLFTLYIPTSFQCPGYWIHPPSSDTSQSTPRIIIMIPYQGPDSCCDATVL